MKRRVDAVAMTREWTEEGWATKSGLDFSLVRWGNGGSTGMIAATRKRLRAVSIQRFGDGGPRRSRSQCGQQTSDDQAARSRQAEQFDGGLCRGCAANQSDNDADAAPPQGKPRGMSVGAPAGAGAPANQGLPQRSATARPRTKPTMRARPKALMYSIGEGTGKIMVSSGRQTA
jgi:hypothetical protein